MTKSEQKKLLAGILSAVILVLGIWQASMIGPSSSSSDDEQEADFAAQQTIPAGFAPFSRVIDGDTIEIAYSKTDKYSVRIIGINAPESVDPRKEVECFGKEASEHLKQLINMKYVRLSTDPSQSGEDKYGRWLRYVYMESGLDLGLQMIKDGYAHEYTYDRPYTNQSAYRAAENEAKAKKIGLWSPETCNGKP